MLAIRMQRTGRRGHAMFRVVVQDARRTPTSGKVVARIGSYDPHAKTVVLDKERAAFYLEHGAQPSDRVVRLLQGEGVKLPKWVTPADKKESAVRNPDKRRSTRPPEAEAPVEAEASAEPEAEATANEEPAEAAETNAETTEEKPETNEEPQAPAEESPAETPEPEAAPAPEQQEEAKPDGTAEPEA